MPSDSLIPRGPRAAVRSLLLAAFSLVCSQAVANAAEKSTAATTNLFPLKDPLSPDGKWRWTWTLPNGQPQESVLKLKLQDGQFTGVFTARNGHETPIENARFKRGELAFQVVRQRDGQKLISRYTGKVSGDVIKGRIQTDWAGETETRDWLAKWDAPKVSKGGVEGTWKWSVSLGPQQREYRGRFKLEGEKVTGVILGQSSETPIEEGRFKNGELSFQYARDFQGLSFKMKFNGKLDGDKITGSVESPGRDGNPRSRDWEAKREEEEAPPKINVAGDWEWTDVDDGGRKTQAKLTVKQEGDKLTGKLLLGEDELNVEHGKVTDEQLSFEVVSQRDDKKVRTKFTGKLEGDSIKGSVDSEAGGVDPADWTAKRAKK